MIEPLRTMKFSPPMAVTRRVHENRGAGPVALWSIVVTNGVLGAHLAATGLGLLVSPSAGDRTTLTMASCLALAGLLLCGLGSVGFHRVYIRRTPTDGRRMRLTTVDGAPAMVLAWGLDRHVVLLASMGCLSAGLLTGGIALLVDDEPAGWILLVLGLLSGCGVPDAAIGAAWRPRMVLTPDRVLVRGRDVEASLTWDDITRVETFSTSTADVLRLVGGRDAPSWRARRRPRVLLAPLPEGPALDVPFYAIDLAPHLLVDALRTWSTQPTTRGEIGTPAAARRLLAGEHVTPFL